VLPALIGRGQGGWSVVKRGPPPRGPPNSLSPLTIWFTPLSLFVWSTARVWDGMRPRKPPAASVVVVQEVCGFVLAIRGAHEG